ncbi:MAG: AMP-dependent synthetase/ligase [Methanobacteriota archaeon]
MAPETLCDVFQESVARHRERPALKDKAQGVWRTITYAGYGRYVRDLSRALSGLGVVKGDRVAIFSKNRPEWAIADFAILHCGAVTVPIYDTLTAAQAAYILEDSGAKVVFVGGDANVAKVQEMRAKLAGLARVVVFDGKADGCESYEALLEEGRAADRRDPAAFERSWKAAAPSDLASFVYTSGTTGNPKGAMLTHGNFTSNVLAVAEVLPVTEEDVLLSFLPLSHVYERMGGHFHAVHRGVAIAYAESIETVPGNLAEIRPTVMNSVPRLYEKMYARILAGVEAAPPRRQRIFRWAVGVGREYVRNRAAGDKVPVGLRAKFRVADRLVFSKLRERTGGRLRFFVSGGAALAPEIAEFFSAAGLWILQGYGLTETSPVLAVNTFDAFRIGSVGKPVPGVEVRIASDGEILAKGPCVFSGYWNLPKESAEAFTEDGWFKTGDIGRIDTEGFLFITDRKKELLVLSNGKKLAPQPVENDLKQLPMVSQAVLVGNGRPYVTALLVPDRAAWKARGLDEASAHAAYQKELDKYNERLARFEQIKRFALLPAELALETGELTPTLKVKRRVVDEKYADVIQGLYPS